MIDQIHLLRIESTVATLFSPQKKVFPHDWKPETPYPDDTHQSYVKYLKDLLDEQQN
jgi:hypothetical protein